MTNIPRRKIYETMLVYEDGLIEMQILLFNEKNFTKFNEKFHAKAYNNIKDAYKEIKALLVLFLQNKKFESEQAFKTEVDRMLTDDMKINTYLNNAKVLPNKFKKILYKIDKQVIPLEEIATLEEGKTLYALLDEFNDQIPKILMIRREGMHLK